MFKRIVLYYVTLFLFIQYTKENVDCNTLGYPCCVNQYLNEVNNSCVECPYGSFGVNCKLSCPSGYYGRLCRYPCECNASECHHVTGCITTNDSHSSTISIKHVTTQTELIQLSTIANATGEVATYQDIEPSGLDRHIHTEDDHTSPVSTIVFSLLGSLSSLCIIGCILLIRSRKKKWKFRGSPSFSRIRQVFLSCVNQDHQRVVIQGSGDIELSNVNASPVSGQEEDDSPYSEIRYSQFIGGATTGGACINTVPCTMLKCNSDKHHNTSEHQNIYKMSMNKNEYDRINLKVKSSDKLSDRNLSLPHSNDEEYVSLLNKQSLGKEVRPKDGLKCQKRTLPKFTMTDCNEMGKSENKPHRLSTVYSLQQLEFEMEVELDISERNKHHSVDADGQIAPQSDNRPYSMAGCLSENNLNETVDESSNLPNINISKNKHLSVNDFSKVVENSVNQIDTNIPGKRENNSQTNARPYSFVKTPEL